MSVVNNYVLKLDLFECRAELVVAALNARIASADPGQGINSFQQVSQLAGGPKNMEVSVYLAALNYMYPADVALLLYDVVAEHQRTLRLPWDNAIQLFCQTQHQAEGGLVRYYP